jgi:hypothetical protein
MFHCLPASPEGQITDSPNFHNGNVLADNDRKDVAGGETAFLYSLDKDAFGIAKFCRPLVLLTQALIAAGYIPANNEPCGY